MLELLLETGRVTQKDLDELSHQDPLGNVVTDLAHSLLCSFEHPKGCHYYNEIGKTNVWSKPAHANWKQAVDQFMMQCDIRTYDDMMLALRGYATLQLHQDVLCVIVAQAIGITNVTSAHVEKLVTFAGALDEPSILPDPEPYELLDQSDEF